MVEPTLQTLGFGLASAAKILQTLKELVGGDARAQVSALYDVILSAQTSALEAHIKQSAMIERIRELEEELTKVRAWETEKQRYKLVAPFTGAMVYALKKSMSDGEPPHYICANCYQDGKRSILQNGKTKEKEGTGWTTFICTACKSEARTPYRGGIPAKYAEDVVTQG